MNHKFLSQTASVFFVLYTFFAALGINVANATTYYVDASTGNNANPGTEALPVQTLSHGASLLSAGDTLLMRGGVYGGLNANTDTIPTGTSWNDAPIISAYPGETVTLRPYGGEAINLTKPYIQYVIFDGLHIDAVNNTVGISIRNEAHHIRFQNVEVKNAIKDGVTIFPGDQVPIFDSFIEFINCEVHHNGSSFLSHGFYISTSSNLVTQSEIHHNSSFGIHAYYSPPPSGNPNVRVNNNVFSRNVVHNNSLNSGSSPAILLSSGDGNMAYNNVIYASKNGIRVENNNPTNSKVFNNTIYKTNPGVGISISAQSTGAIVKNNFILWDTGDGIQDAGLNTMVQSNLEIDLPNTPTFAPKFVDAANFDFHLQTGSPAIDAGTTVTQVVNDFDDVARPQGSDYDVGAFEFPNGGDPPPAVPTGLTASASGTTITLIWTANTEPDLTGYKVFRGTSPGNYPSVTQVGTVVSYQATGLNAGTTYYFALKALDAGSNESGLSSEVSATTTNGGSFPPAMSTPAPGSTLTSTTVTFIGGTTPQDVAHALWVGTTLGAKDLHFGPMTGNTQVVPGLPTSGTIYVRYWTTDDPNTSNGAAWVFTEHTHTMNVGPVTHSLTVALAGSGTGVVTSAPTGITCGSTCTGTYDVGTTVTLTATPTSGATLANWSGGGCSGNGVCIVTVSQATTVTATFTAPPAFPPSMASPAPGSTLTSTTVTFIGGTTPQDIAHSLWVGTTSGSNNLHVGPMTGNTQVVSGLPTSGTIYVRYWTTDDPNTSNGAAWVFTEHTYTMNVAPVTHLLTVSSAGSGTGVVTSSPAGITCGSTCTGSYDAGTTVTLTASPTSGATFDSWTGGGCSGNGACVVTMTQANTVTTTFTAAPIFPASMSTPAPGSTLTSTSVTFIGGTTPQDIAHSLWVGTTAGSNNLYAGPMTGNTQVVTGLPTSGTIYVRYWTTDDPNTSNGAAWVFTEQTYTMNAP